MAEQSGELRQINWEACFPFTRIFKTFGLAIQPNKLGLALAGVVLMGIWGGLLDFVWSKNVKPVGPEVWAYWQVPDIHTWRNAARTARIEVLQDVYGSGGLLHGKGPKDPNEYKSPKAIQHAKDRLKHDFRKEAAKLGDDKAAIASLALRYDAALAGLDPFERRGVFSSFLDFEHRAIGQFLNAGARVLLLDFGAVTRGANEVISARYRTSDIRRAGEFDDIGMIGSLLLVLRGGQWLVVQHPFFAVLFGLGSLAIWSIFGGGICRAAALAVARDEHLSPKTALDFGLRKFLAFFSAPLVPVIMILGIGVLLWLGGFLLQIPYAGEVLGGPLMILALAGGFVMTLVLVGAIGGGGLLWPTIAVEGTDGFDAMARGYTYFYSRPWRLAFYAITAAAYAGATYIALRYFVYVLLRMTRFFVGAGAGVFTARPGTGSPYAGKLDAIWPLPLPGNLMGRWEPASLGRMNWESFAAFFVWLFVLLLVLTLCAYLISFFFSAATIIYTLLRQKVDAIDFEDIFVETQESETAAATPVPVVAAEPTSPTPPAPPSTPEGDEPGGQSAPPAP